MTNQAGMIWHRWSLSTRDILYVGCSAPLSTPWGGIGMSEYDPRQGARDPDRELLYDGGRRNNAAQLSVPAPLRVVSAGARSPAGIFVRSESAHWQSAHNNLTEQRIRPVAPGCRNFLFAGSDAGAHRLATLYTPMGSLRSGLHRRSMGPSPRPLGQAQPRLATASHRRTTASTVEDGPGAVASGRANLCLPAGDLGGQEVVWWARTKQLR